MKIFNIGNGHTITVEPGKRGLENDYKVTFYEDGKRLWNPEYMDKEAIEYQYEIILTE